MGIAWEYQWEYILFMEIYEYHGNINGLITMNNSGEYNGNSMGISMGLYFIRGIVTPEKNLNSPMEIEIWETQCPKLTIWE